MHEISEIKIQVIIRSAHNPTKSFFTPTEFVQTAFNLKPHIKLVYNTHTNREQEHRHQALPRRRTRRELWFNGTRTHKHWYPWAADIRKERKQTSLKTWHQAHIMCSMRRFWGPLNVIYLIMNTATITDPAEWWATDVKVQFSAKAFQFIFASMSATDL